MAREIETKFKITSPTALRKKLKKIGAKFISKEFEKDIYYNAPPGTRPFTARLRARGNKNIFTIKTPVRAKSRRYKVLDEIEVPIKSREVFNKILIRLGFSPGFRKGKTRETYKWKNAKICIDKIYPLGTYAEIEAPKKRIREIARLLGLNMLKAIPGTYIGLLRKRKRRKKPS
jgi:predicted adenylyl cyclase CyaB